MKINEQGFWENPTGEGHAFDKTLAGAIVKLFQKHHFNSVLDLGCGMGDYAHLLQAYNYKVHAYDGNPNTPQLTVGLGQVADLSQPFDCGEQVDVVMSLEVGEHIPKEFEQTFLDNLVVNRPKMIILSWAIPGQAGDGHVNCQTNRYIINKIERENYCFLPHTTHKLRKESSLWWFKKSLMVFE
jgi:2-polyprenyl-3-methyl-5-hydroxy-6-metoxy-1,4-benzoquinol methylase